MSKSINKLIAEKFLSLKVGEEIKKSDITTEIWGYDDYFIRRSFDVHVVNFKKLYTEIKLQTHKSGIIKRLS